MAAGVRGLVAGQAQRDGDVAEVLRHPAVHRPQRVQAGRGAPDEVGEARIQRRCHRVAVAHQACVPARHIRPRQRGSDHEADVDAVGIGRERLAHRRLRNVGGGPLVDAPPVCQHGARLGADVALPNLRRQRRRHVEDQPRPAGRPAGGDAPAREEVARHDRLERLDRVAVIHQQARREAAQRGTMHLGVGVHRILERRGHVAFLLVAGPLADHRAVGPEDPCPVERELLAGTGVGEAQLAPRLHAVLGEDLHHLPVGAGAAAVGLEAHHAVVEQVDVRLVGIVRRLDGQRVDGVAAHRRIAGGRHDRRLGEGRRDRQRQHGHGQESHDPSHYGCSRTT